MILKCTGMQSILNGFLRQRVTPRAELLKAVETAGDHREVRCRSIEIFSFKPMIYTL